MNLVGYIRLKIGVMIGADNPESGLNDVIGLAKKAEELGLDSAWLANIFSYDAILTMALIGRETNTIHLGTAVTPTYPRHPVAMAQQALTTAAASDNRFTLGIGLSHKLVIEDMFGLSYSKPIRHMKEYLGVCSSCWNAPAPNEATARTTMQDTRIKWEWHKGRPHKCVYSH